MKKLLSQSYFGILSLMVLLLVGCSDQEVSQNIGSEIPVEPLKNTAISLDLDSTQREEVETLSAGKTCNNQDLICGESLECVFGEKETGICTEKIVKDITCGKEQNPVCGLKNAQKLGYLNACEAERHGAVILNEGLCIADESVVGSCEASVAAVGNCSDSFVGFAFDASDSGACKKSTVRGCSAEIPFETAESCLSTCISNN